MSTLFSRKDKEAKSTPASPVATTSNGASATIAQVTTPAPQTAPPTADEAAALSVLDDFRNKIKKGLPFDWNTSSVAAILDLIRNKEAIDDRKLFLEHALSFISKLEEGPLAKTLKEKIIQLLYNDLTHPAATSISPKYSWRTADGSYNNIDVPDMGKAGTPYSRSVQQSAPLPNNQLPDPGLLFDTLLKREGFVKHPGGLSSCFFSFAALVIHTCFRTGHRDVNINETSSYVDLAPLYGNNVEDQNRIRVRDGRGLLHPDTFAEDRLLLLPPAVCVLLVLFNRNHNYIASKLLEINERGHFIDPSTVSLDDPAAKSKLLEQEEELFQTARLINVGWFGTVVFSDYFSCILGLVRDGNSWSLTPFDEIRKEDHSLFERGKGNVVSVEFNCLYRWHATTSREDEKWTEQIFGQVFHGKRPDEITANDFRMAAAKMESVQPDPSHWTFGGLKRQADGSFKDDDLANILHNATEHSAGAFRARGTPEIMRLNEIMGIEQSRRWGVCSLNDFRKYLGLKTYTTFEEWNPDPEIWKSAELLYGDINKLELYVGLQAEAAKPLVDGAGLCPGYTISRAILSDAIALTRGDRFFTHDFTPFNLTSWGFQDCQRDPNAFGFGSTLGRLFLRTLPNNFTENSVYTFFPLMTPDSMKTHLTKLKQLDKYDLARPKPQSPITIITNTPEVLAVIKDTTGFKSSYAQRAQKVIKGKGFYPAEGIKEQTIVSKALSGSPQLVQAIGSFFYEQTKKHIDQYSFGLVGGKRRGINVVEKVTNLVGVVWVADLAGISLKTPANDTESTYTAQELFNALSDIYSYIFLNVEPARVMVLQERVKNHVTKLIDLIDDNIAESKFSIASLLSVFKKKPIHYEAIHRIGEAAEFKSRESLSNAILAIMVVATAEVSLAATNALDLYLSNEKVKELKGLCDAKNTVQIQNYVYDALRTVPPFRGVYRVSTKPQVVAGRTFQEGERVFVDITGANAAGTDAPGSDAEKNLLRAEGAFDYLGETLTVEILTQILRGVFERNNLTRAPGNSGLLHSFNDNTRPECHFTYLNHSQAICEWPTSLSVLYDA